MSIQLLLLSRSLFVFIIQCTIHIDSDLFTVIQSQRGDLYICLYIRHVPCVCEPILRLNKKEKELNEIVFQIFIYYFNPLSLLWVAICRLYKRREQVLYIHFPPFSFSAAQQLSDNEKCFSSIYLRSAARSIQKIISRRPNSFQIVEHITASSCERVFPPYID